MDTTDLQNEIIKWVVTAVLLGGIAYSAYTSVRNDLKIIELSSQIEKLEQKNNSNQKRLEDLNIEIVKLNQTQSIVERKITYSGKNIQETYGNDVVNRIKIEDESSKLLSGRKAPHPPLPDGLNHILTFFQEPISTGEGLKAVNFKEAWVMAYIEKHMGDFSYNDQPIYMYGDRLGKRDAIIRLVKQQGADVIFDKIAPIQ